MICSLGAVKCPRAYSLHLSTLQTAENRKI